MKKLLLFALMAFLAYGASAQNWLTKFSSKIDSLNSKTRALKRRSDSAKASMQMLTGRQPSATPGTVASNGTSIPNQTVTNIPASASGTANTNTGDQLVFTLTGCSGSTGAQTVTLSFTIANPVKVNQTINIGVGPACKAIDQDGDDCRPKECMLANGNGAAYTELPTGLTMKGSITFANVLSKEQQLAMVQFNIFTRNSDGGRDPHVKAIDLRNVPISWQ